MKSQNKIQKLYANTSYQINPEQKIQYIEPNKFDYIKEGTVPNNEIY